MQKGQVVDLVFKIDGVDFSRFIADSGIAWSRSDLESDKAGRTLDGKMHRGRVATKIRLDITCLPQNAANTSLILNAIYPEFVTVEYDDPMYGHVTKTMYSNNNPAKLVTVYDDGEMLWDGITFPLIEQ